MTDEHSFTALEAQKKRRKKKKIFISLILLLLLFVTVYLFSPVKVHYDDMPNGARAIKDGKGNIRIEYGFSHWSGLFGVGYTVRISDTVLIDLETGTKYYYNYVTYKAARVNIWFGEGKSFIGECVKMTPDGGDLYRPGWFDSIDRSQYTADDYLDNPDLLLSRYLRIYYENPDGTFTLMWEHPDAAEIAERCGVELSDLPEPQDAFHPAYIKQLEKEKETQQNQGE